MCGIRLTGRKSLGFDVDVGFQQIDGLVGHHKECPCIGIDML